MSLKIMCVDTRFTEKLKKSGFQTIFAAFLLFSLVRLNVNNSMDGWTYGIFRLGVI